MKKVIILLLFPLLLNAQEGLKVTIKKRMNRQL
jgi:hypothetical protein